MTEETKTNPVTINLKESSGLLDKLRSFLTAKEKLTDKMTVALSVGGTGCANGDRGMIIKAVCEHDTIEDRQRYWFIWGAMSTAILLTTSLTFLFNCLSHMIGT